MIHGAAAMRPLNLGPEVITAAAERPRRNKVRITGDLQTAVAARLQRESVSVRLRVLQKLVPGGSKMDTASMLDEAASYLEFLKSQVQALETFLTLGIRLTLMAASWNLLKSHQLCTVYSLVTLDRHNPSIIKRWGSTIPLPFEDCVWPKTLKT